MSLDLKSVCVCVREGREEINEMKALTEDSFINTYLSHRSSSPFFLSFNLPMLTCDGVAPEWTSSLLKTDEGGAAESQGRKSIKDNNEGEKDPERMRNGGDNGSSDESRKRMCSNCVNIHTTTYICLKQNKNY